MTSNHGLHRPGRARVLAGVSVVAGSVIAGAGLLVGTSSAGAVSSAVVSAAASCATPHVAAAAPAGILPTGIVPSGILASASPTPSSCPSATKAAKATEHPQLTVSSSQRGRLHIHVVTKPKARHTTVVFFNVSGGKRHHIGTAGTAGSGTASASFSKQPGKTLHIQVRVAATAQTTSAYSKTKKVTVRR